MNITLYVIKSESKKFRYVGITRDLPKRIARHNQTKSIYAPFKLIHAEEFSDYKSARAREVFLKSGKGREFLDTLN